MELNLRTNLTVFKHLAKLWQAQLGDFDCQRHTMKPHCFAPEQVTNMTSQTRSGAGKQEPRSIKELAVPGAPVHEGLQRHHPRVRAKAARPGASSEEEIGYQKFAITHQILWKVQNKSVLN